MPRASLFARDCALQFQSKPVDDGNTAVTRASGIICLISHLKATIVYNLYIFLSEFRMFVFAHTKKDIVMNYSPLCCFKHTIFFLPCNIEDILENVCAVLLHMWNENYESLPWNNTKYISKIKITGSLQFHRITAIILLILDFFFSHF